MKPTMHLTGPVQVAPVTHICIADVELALSPGLAAPQEGLWVSALAVCESDGWTVKSWFALGNPTVSPGHPAQPPAPAATQPTEPTAAASAGPAPASAAGAARRLSRFAAGAQRANNTAGPAAPPPAQPGAASRTGSTRPPFSFQKAGDEKVNL